MKVWSADQLSFWRHRGDKPAVITDPDQNDLWWVKVILNVGRPVVAVIVLVMCAPGEHHLAVLAGWSDWLAWGMPATLTAYAGIAAVVATKRPKKSPGKKTAVAGAIVSVLLAMGAQPISHLYEQQLITGYEVPLTIIVSCIPALVFGHLLHMAAAPVGIRVPKITPGSRTVPPGVVTFDGDEDMVRAHELINTLPDGDLVIYDEEEISEPGPDAMRYEPGDEEGIDAGLDTLRAPVRSMGGVIEPMVADARREIYGGDDPMPSFEDNYVRPRPSDQELTSYLTDGPWNADRLRQEAQDALSRVPTVVPDDVPGTRDNGIVDPLSVPSEGPFGVPVSVRPDVPPGTVAFVPPVSRDEDTGQIQDMSPGGHTAVSRLVPARRPGTASPGITQRVRDMLEINPDMTNEAIKAACPGDNPDSVKRATNRVRKELDLNTD